MVTVSREKLKNYVQYRRKLTEYPLHETINRTLNNPDNAVTSLSYSKNTLKVTTDSGRMYEVDVNRGNIVKLNRKYVLSTITKEDSDEDYTGYKISDYEGGEVVNIKSYKNGDPDKDTDKTKILSTVSTDNSNESKTITKFNPYKSGSGQAVTIETPKSGFQSKYDTSKVANKIEKTDKDTDILNNYVITSYDNKNSYTIKTTKKILNYMNYSPNKNIYKVETNLLNSNYSINYGISNNDAENSRFIYRKQVGGYAYYTTRDVGVAYKSNSSSNYGLNKLLGNNGIDTDINNYYRYQLKSASLCKITTGSNGSDTYGAEICSVSFSIKGLNNNYWNTINNFNLYINQTDTKNIGKLYSGDNLMCVKFNDSTLENILNINTGNGFPAYLYQNTDDTLKKFIGETYYYDDDTKKSLSIKATLTRNSGSFAYLNLYVTDLSSDNLFNNESGKEIKINSSKININMTRYSNMK